MKKGSPKVYYYYIFFVHKSVMSIVEQYLLMASQDEKPQLEYRVK